MPDKLTPEEISEFCNLIGLAPRQLRAAREDMTERFNLGPRGAWIVGLVESGVDAPSAITDVLCIRRSLVTAELIRLTDAGLLSRERNPGDGRRLRLSLTAAGRDVADQLRRELGELVHSRFEDVTREELMQFFEILRKFVAPATRLGQRGR